MDFDSQFKAAVSAIDAGDVSEVERLLTAHPDLVRQRLERPGRWLRDAIPKPLGGFFKQPYLLWFVAEDPVRNGSLPRNIAQIATAIIRAAQREGVDSLQEQIDYALRLVAWSWIARESGVQIELIDVLADAGASLTGTPDAAIFNGNFAAADHLLVRGAPLTLSAALCLGRWADAERLAPAATLDEKKNAMVVAALHGKAEALATLLRLGLDPTTIGPDIYPHATVLHHAVCSGSLEAVQVLVDAGADVQRTDTAYDGTPLGWAEHYLREPTADTPPKQYAEIAAYLRARTVRR